MYPTKKLNFNNIVLGHSTWKSTPTTSIVHGGSRRRWWRKNPSSVSQCRLSWHRCRDFWHQRHHPTTHFWVQTGSWTCPGRCFRRSRIHSIRLVQSCPERSWLRSWRSWGRSAPVGGGRRGRPVHAAAAHTAPPPPRRRSPPCRRLRPRQNRAPWPTCWWSPGSRSPRSTSYEDRSRCSPLGERWACGAATIEPGHLRTGRPPWTATDLSISNRHDANFRLVTRRRRWSIVDNYSM